MDEKILTPEQVANILQIHQFTVLKFIKQGKLKASKLGRMYRIRQSDIELFLEESANGKKKSKEPQETGTAKNWKNQKQKQTSLSPNHDAGDDATPEPVSRESKVASVDYHNEEKAEAGEDKYYILQ